MICRILAVVIALSGLRCLAATELAPLLRWGGIAGILMG